ncbi:hypothetical protein Athai_60850 [Actinocatenispora thailandica]|uniref:Uncharacterized protein n=1 Tax=Actinocatenispora thailandica TaxID=227318 RepID=A0A7R7DWC6_9ACTN|nr:hypothetical protein Athai_60850 [Actinocatenispora thailandica]
MQRHQGTHRLRQWREREPAPRQGGRGEPQQRHVRAPAFACLRNVPPVPGRPDRAGSMVANFVARIAGRARTPEPRYVLITLKSLLVPPFRPFFLGRLVSQLGSAMAPVALAFGY